MRRAVWMAALALLTLSLGTGGAAAEEMPSEESVLLAYIGVWNTGELERLDDLVTADFQRNAGPTESCTSIDSLKDVIGQVRQTFDKLEISIDDYMTESGQGALRGDFFGVHRSVDRVVKFPLMSMYRFEDGRLAEEWILGNNFLSLVGLGYELVPPGFEIIDPVEPTMDVASEGTN